jgi:N5-(cytidine 5'-diphosphoramidyl)-L-glutamine hydrolase
MHPGTASPLKLIGITQSVQIVAGSDGVCTRHDILDHLWVLLLEACGCLALPIPNHPHLASRFLNEIPIDGLLLACGNELAVHGGRAPECDRTEFVLLTHAIHNKLPVLGVGRGMQIIQRLFSVPLQLVDHHISPTLEIDINGRRETVNSDHRYGTTKSTAEFKVWARADDGVVKAIENEKHRLTGIMWRPERMAPFATRDIELIKRTFNTHGRVAGH